MNLFLDTISPKNTLILFNNNRDIIKTYHFDVRLNESTKLIEEVDSFLKLNNLNYFDLENIVVVNWPGSFTWVRTTILLVNTINFIIKKNISTITYFDLFEWIYPIIKASSKRDSFVKLDKDSEIIVLENDKISDVIKENNIKIINSDTNFLENIEVISEVNYDKIIKNIKLEPNSIVSPFYFKKPNIS